MSQKLSTKSTVQLAQAALKNRIDFDAFIEKLGAKERIIASKHVSPDEEGFDPKHADLWKRLTCTLMMLSAHFAKLNGQQSVQFYIADGKYRKQVFALEDLGPEQITIYCADVLDEAIKGKLLEKSKTAPADANEFKLTTSSDAISVERIDGASSNLADFCKHMVGWNRRAIRMNVPTRANEAQITAVETLCAMSMVQHGGQTVPHT